MKEKEYYEEIKDWNFDDFNIKSETLTNFDIYEVLKKGGYLFVHGVDKYDCHELKLIFGKGQAFNDLKPISIVDYENILAAGFFDVELIQIHTKEYFKTRNDLYNFLLKVPILEDFSEDVNNII